MCHATTDYMLAVITLLLVAIGCGLTNSLTGLLLAFAFAWDFFFPSSNEVIFAAAPPNCS